MSDVWYYALDGKSVGPLTRAQLIDTISQMPRAEATLVWQSGLPDWRKASDFPELLPYVVKPPPLPPRPPPLPPRISVSPLDPNARLTGEPSVSEVEAAQFKDAKAELAGIGGWLAIVAIGQVLGPLRLLVSLGQYYEKLDKSIVESFPIVVWGEAAMNASMFLLTVSTAILFFSHSRKFPTFFIWQWLVVVMLPFIDAAWIAVSMAAYTGRNPTGFVNLEPKEIGQSIAYTIIGGVWIAYILKSKRVANTFIK
jgi:hypothetical protein